MALPAYVLTGLVSGESIVASVDTATDSDFEPDAAFPVGSTFSLDPSVPYLRFTDQTPPATVYLQNVKAVVGADGTVQTPDGSPLRMVANVGQQDDEAGQREWFWKVTPAIEGMSGLASFRLDIPANGTAYLTEQQPIPVSTTLFALKGDQGDPGVNTPPAGTPEGFIASAHGGAVVWEDPTSLGLAGAAVTTDGAAGTATISEGSTSATVYTKTKADTLLGLKANTSDLTAKLDASKVGAANGVAPLGADQKVPAANLPAASVSTKVTVDGTAGTVTVNDGTTSGISYSKTKADTLLGLKVDATKLGAASGVATLGSDGKVPASQLPSGSGGSLKGAVLDGLVASSSSSGATDNAAYWRTTLSALGPGHVVIIPDAPHNQSFYFASELDFTTYGTDYHFWGGSALQEDVGSSTDSGPCLKATNTFTGTALIRITDDGATPNPQVVDHISFEGIKFITPDTCTTIQDCIADGSNQASFINCGVYGGQRAAYNGIESGGSAGGANRTNFVNCGFAANNSVPDCVAWKIGTDQVWTGGRGINGAHVLAGSGAQVVGAHLTGDSTNFCVVHNLGSHNSVIGCQIDTGIHKGLIWNEAIQFLVDGCDLYSLTSSTTSTPCIVISGSTASTQILNCVIARAGAAPQWTYFVSFGAGQGSTANHKSAAQKTQVRNIRGLTSNSFAKLWDFEPGDYAGLVYNDTAGNTRNLASGNLSPAAKALGVSAVTYDPAYSDPAGLDHSALTAGVLYVAMIDHPASTVSQIGFNFLADWVGQSLFAFRLYMGNGGTLTALAAAAAFSSTTAGATLQNVTGLPEFPGQRLAIAFAFTGAPTAGKLNVPIGGLRANSWAANGTENLRFAKVTGVTIGALADFPASIAESNLIDPGVPGPPLLATVL